jgi:hypothetical protein
MSELPTKRCPAEVSVHPLAALVSSADTIRTSKLTMPGAGDAVCIRSFAAHANEGEKPFDIIFSNLQWS